ncbi:MAG: hypothetical protein ACI9U2_004779 [Bradymonadia bacterium]|jgi:hypothetical protein
MLRLAVLMSAISLGGCVQDSDGESILGESCASTGDCAPNLRCIDQVCIPRIDAGDDSSVGDMGAGDANQSEMDAEPGPPPLPQPAATSMLAIAASVDASKPLLFSAIVNVDAERRRLRVTLTALTADEDRTEVGEAFVAVSDLNLDGRFKLDFGRILMDGAADPIIPGAPIEADMTLQGTLTETLCGTVSGSIVQPAMLPLEGSFGTTPVDDGDFAGQSVVDACPER